MEIDLPTAGAGIQLIGYAIAAELTSQSGLWRKWLREQQP